MANIKSAKKRTRKIVRQTIANKNIRNRVRTFVKKVDEAMGESKDAAKTAMIAAESELMKSASKGIISKQAAARKISRLSAKVKAMS